MKKNIYDISLENLRDILVLNGFEKYRARQVFDKLNAGISSFDNINNIPKKLRLFLNENFYIEKLTLVKRLVSKKDSTKKYLFELADGNTVETVLMMHNYGSSICISSQVGCLMGCAFCASGLNSKIRDLRSSEMAGQIYEVSNIEHIRIDNVVVMGSGEPFDNYENLMKLIKTINDPNRLNIGQRHITVSTCGIVPKIYDFADENLQVNLAISLHSADNEKRKQLMPIAKKYELDSLKKAADYYIKKTGRKLSYEYSLIKNFNDSRADADKLIRFAGNKLVYVNLIPINTVKENSFERPEKETIEFFEKYLKKNKVNAVVRKEMGSDINGACGQLRNLIANSRADMV